MEALPPNVRLVDFVAGFLGGFFGLKSEEIHLEQDSSGRVGGYVCAERFSGQPQMERQRALYAGLSNALDPKLQSQIGAILTMTPKEIEDEPRPRVAKILLADVKDSDGWAVLCSELGLPDSVRDSHFKYGEFGTLELEIDQSLRVVGGRVIPSGGP